MPTKVTNSTLTSFQSVCETCNGECCKRIDYFLGSEDEKRWFELHGLKTREFGEFWWGEIPIPCTKYKDGKCEIHDTKPDMCRSYYCEKATGTKYGHYRSDNPD